MPDEQQKLEMDSALYLIGNYKSIIDNTEEVNDDARRTPLDNCCYPPPWRAGICWNAAWKASQSTFRDFLGNLGLDI